MKRPVLADSRYVFSAILNRTQLLVVGFLVLVWIALVEILVLSPEVYTRTLRKVGGDGLAIEASFLIALSLGWGAPSRSWLSSCRPRAGPPSCRLRGPTSLPTDFLMMMPRRWLELWSGPDGARGP